MPRPASLAQSNRSSRSPSVHSLSSTASAAVGHATKALASLKSSVRKALHSKKKARTQKHAEDTDRDDDVQDDEDDEAELERLQATWRSPVYSFFKPKVEISYEGERKVHIFHCAAKRCKEKGSVRRYQDSKDKAATSNLKTHAIKCFGEDVVNAVFHKDDSTLSRNGSIFAAFARQGQQPVSISHRALSTDETQHVSSFSLARIALWCAESNRPMKLVTDRQFTILMKAGRPGTSIPSPSTVSRDVKATFEVRIDEIIRNHDGKVHFATDAWTSPNHRPMVAWTVHLHHQSNILIFLLDVVEVPTVSTSTAVKRVFSQGRQLLYYTRNRLSPASIRALMCLGHWSRKDLVTSAEVVEAIKRRHQDDNEDDKE
ncbi:hypothetical protein H0H92_007644 [Tricholoma furcatifolium]|nr:hypothetical protein H0H92_007644 [Tricholoma furcatifolium]